jgi:hypothetical protein
MPPPVVTFDGIPDITGAIPPDPSGADGLTQYAEVVNDTFDIYSKSGAPLLPEPVPTQTL